MRNRDEETLKTVGAIKGPNGFLGDLGPLDGDFLVVRVRP